MIILNWAAIITIMDKIMHSLPHKRHLYLLLALSALFALPIKGAHAGDAKQASLRPAGEEKNISPNDRFSLKYNLLRSDLRLMQLGFNIHVKGDSYQASHNLKSKGLVKLFADTKSRATVEGKIGKKSLAPGTFQISSGKKDKVKTAELSWQKGILSRTVQPKLSNERAKTLEPVLKNADILDPLSGLLSLVMFDDAQNPCAQTVRMFEGRKIFDLRYSYAGRDKIKKSDAGAFRGPTHKCKINVIPIAGYSEKKMRKAIKENRSHIVWIARIKSPTSENSYLMPVKMRASTKFGLIDIVLDKGKINGKKLRKSAIALN